MTTNARRDSRSLTVKQRDAITSNSRRLIVTASAGCGKTHALTGIYLSEVEKHGIESLPGIVALTFTNKAARELRERVGAALGHRIPDGADAVTKSAIRAAVGVAPISTFHAYCGTLLRRYAKQAGVLPGFREIDESIGASLQEQALRRSVERWLSNSDADFLHLARVYGIASLGSTLLSLLRTRALRFAERGARADAAEMLDRWQREFEHTVLPQVVSGACTRARTSLDVMEANPCSLASVQSNLAKLSGYFSTAESRPAADVLRDLRLTTKLNGTNASHWGSPTAQARFKAAMADMKESIESLESLAAVSAELSRAMAERAMMFERLSGELELEYDAIKRADAVVDFDDLQLGVLRFLRDGPVEVVRPLCDEYHAILVDEFQDTDPIQAEILERLCDTGVRDPRLVVVGDLKQSIYGFRGARPEIFAALRDKVPDGQVGLNTNFRSVPTLVHFFNALFADVFDEPDYAMTPRRPEPSGSEFPRIELLECADQLAPPAASIDERRRIEAKAIATLLAQRLRDGWTIADPSDGRPRHAAASDIALLFRTTIGLDHYQKALQEVGLDAHIVGGRTFYAQQEIIDVANALECVEDPNNEIALAGFLRAPNCGVSDDGLYWLATSRFGGLACGFAAHDRINDLAPLDRARIERAAALLSGWRAMKDSVALPVLVDRVLEESGLEASALLDRYGSQSFANLRKLSDLARGMDSLGHGALADFVRRLRSAVLAPPPEEQASITEEQGTAVRLMTIHQAKGLEFPIVVLPHLDAGHQQRQSESNVLFHPTLGLIPVPADAIDRHEILQGDSVEQAESAISTGQFVYNHFRESAERAEALRLFYVATTRARDFLFMSTTRWQREEPKSEPLRLLGERFRLDDGQCQVELSDDWPRPALRIVRPPSLGGQSASVQPRAVRRERGAPLALVARALERALASPLEPDRSTHASILALAIGPAPMVLAQTAQLDALLRALIERATFARPAIPDFDRLIADSAKLLSPRPGPSQLGLAKARFGAWVTERLAPLVANASELDTGVPFVASVDYNGAPQRLSGTVDLDWSDSNSVRHLLVVQLEEIADDERAALRLALGADALSNGCEIRTHVVTLHADGSWTDIEPAALTGPERDDAIRRVIQKD